jgi:hypothetical protein
MELYRLQTYFMDVMTADVHSVATINDLFELKEAIHSTRKLTRIVAAQVFT